VPREGEGGINDLVAEFLREYPARDVAPMPQPVRQALKIALLKTDRATMLDAVQQFAAAMRKAGKVGSRYVPKPETWLADHGWEAYPPPPAERAAPAGGEASGKLPEDPRWAPVYAQLVTALGADTASSWFRNVRLLGIEGDVATIAAPTRFLARWVDDHYAPQLLAAFRAVHVAIARVEILDPSRARRAAGDPADVLTEPPAPDRRAAEQELARQTVTTEGCRKVAVWLGTHELLPAIQEINGWLTQLGNDAVALAKIIAEATHIGMPGKAALGWVRQQVKAHAAPNVLMHEPVEVKAEPAGAAKPIGKRGRRGGRR
jgi:hypothetical protein